MHLWERHPIAAFFVLTYVISWAFWLPAAVFGLENNWLLVAGTFGPTVAALLLTAVADGTTGLSALARRLFIWRVEVGWYLFSFGGTVVFVLAALALYQLGSGGDNLTFNDPAQWYLVIPVFLYVLFFSVLGEEIGWRGYALPRLQGRYTALKASLVIGFIWSGWHLPLFWRPGDFHQAIPLLLFLWQSLALAIVYTWLFNRTGGSLLIVHIFHAASNTTLGVLPVLPMDTGGELTPLWLTVGLLWAFTAVLLIRGSIKPPAAAWSGDQ